MNKAGLGLAKHFEKTHALRTPNRFSLKKSPSSEAKAWPADKGKHGPPLQQLKHAFHIRPTVRWVRFPQAGKASSSGLDLMVEVGLERPEVACAASNSA